MNNYLDELNEEQRAAVEFINGPQLIIAGAGSGKTRALTYKIVHLIHSGFNPSNILSLTFTNKAAREMQERMKELVEPQKVSKLWMGTFHSIFARILRIESSFLGYPASFTIYDAEDSKREIKAIIKQLKLDKDQYPERDIYGRISKAKNNLILPSTYQRMPEIQMADAAVKKPETGRIYAMYHARCKKSGAMDFDDLLLNINILFRDFPDILKKYQNLFKYILVDEYQDTNYAQYMIVKKLSSAHRKICVVGDDSQSIYAFRGAKIENILNFKKDFKELKTYKLERNYRSTQNIVNIANSLIEKNDNRIPKNIYTQNDTGEKVALREMYSDKREAYFVAKKIQKIKKDQGIRNQDFAVLYRTNAQSRVFEDVMRKYSIPYRLFGSISFYQRSEIKNVVAYLRLIINKNDDQAFKRIINFPKRGIGNTTIEKLNNIAVGNEMSLWEVLQNLDKLGSIFNSGTITKLRKFVNLIKYFDEAREENNPNELVELVLDRAGIKKTMAEDRSVEGIGKFENLQEFTNAVQDYVENKEGEKQVALEQFLEEIALATDQDEKDTDNDKVSLMTIHASKGLEFKYVFIVGVEEGLFPSFRSVTNPKDIEEERRLFYVAITRCEKQLFISYTTQRMKWGRFQAASPSRFLGELDKKYIDFEKSTEENNQNFGNKQEYSNFAQKTKEAYQAQEARIIGQTKKLKPVEKNRTEQKIKTKNSDEITGLSVGMKVEHSKFGEGLIVEIEGEFPNTKATVEFKSVGQKKLLLKFAKLKIL